MDSINWLALVSLLMVAVLVFSGGWRRTRGHRLVYGAIWLAVIVALVAVYRLFGPV